MENKMKYSLVKIESLASGAKFVRLESVGPWADLMPITYTVLKREQIRYEWGMFAYVDNTHARYHFKDGTLVFAEDP